MTGARAARKELAPTTLDVGGVKPAITRPSPQARRQKIAARPGLGRAQQSRLQSRTLQPYIVIHEPSRMHDSMSQARRGSQLV